MARRIPKEMLRTRVVGRLTRSPESESRNGETVCRLFVAQPAQGIVSTPATVAVYVAGELARRCAEKFEEGYLIESFGDLQPLRPRAKHPELIAEKVRLWDEGVGMGATA